MNYLFVRKKFALHLDIELPQFSPQSNLLEPIPLFSGA